MNTQTRIMNTLTAIVALVVLTIGAFAFVTSYDALYATGLQNGIPEAKAWIWPLLIDAPLVVFTLAVLVAQISRQGIKLWAVLVILYTLATIGFNLAHAVQTWLGWAVAIAAPVGLLLTTEALRHLAKFIIERQAMIESLAELAAHYSDLAARRDALAAQVDRLESKLSELKSEEKRNKGGTPARVTDDTKAQALTILAERSAISGAELGRLLGKSESLGRRLKRELESETGTADLPAGTADLPAGTTTIESDSQTGTPAGPGALERISQAARDSGRDDVADIIETAKRGWNRVNGGGS